MPPAPQNNSTACTENPAENVMYLYMTEMTCRRLRIHKCNAGNRGLHDKRADASFLLPHNCEGGRLGMFATGPGKPTPDIVAADFVGHTRVVGGMQHADKNRDFSS